MLLVDGTNTGDFWGQSVSLAANTTYSFTYYVTNADLQSGGDIAFSLNGAAVDAGFEVTGEGGGSKWQQVTESFTTTSAGAYSLGLSDTNGVAQGNDFAIDDISLRRTLTPPTGKTLLANGDFSSEIQGFSSDYTYESPNSGISTTVGEYSIVTNPSTAFTNGYSSYGDHTGGDGRMLFVDGTNTGDFWRESVSLAANTTYSFTYFVTGADDSNLPAIAFSVNGATIDAGFQVSAQGGGSNWQQVTASFTTARGSYTVALSDLDGVAEGNDFTLDDLSLVRSRPGAPDKTPPTVTAPSGVMVVADSAGGAAAFFSASAQDLVDGPTDPVTFTELLGGGATQSAYSGEVFSLGDHTIVATATDRAGNTGSAGFDIDVTSGVATGAVISGGSYQEVYGVAEDSAILSGGTQFVISTGLAIGTTVSNGGVLTVEVGGFTSDTRVLSGGLVSGPGMASGVMTVLSGATISGTCFGHGATDLFYAGASEASVTISSAAVLKLVDAAIAGGAFAIGPITAPESVSGAYLISGARLETLDAGVQNGGVLEVTAGGFATATTVSSGGVETLAAGAVALGATVLSDGALSGPGALRDTLTVSAGGTVTDVHVSAGATVIDNGLLVYSGTAIETLAGALSGGGAILEDGPGRLIVSGGTAAFTGTATLSGGVIDLADATGLGGGEVGFEQTAGATTLDVEAANRPANGATYATALGDFDSSTKRLDLRGLTVSSGAHATQSGTTLTVVDGAYTATFTLSGMAAASYVVVDDGAGGALIRAAVGAATHSLVQAAAGFGPQAGSPAGAPLIDAHAPAAGPVTGPGGQRIRLALA